MDGVKGCLNVRGLTIQKTKECVKDKREWRRFVGESDVVKQSEASCLKSLTHWKICYVLL